MGKLNDTTKYPLVPTPADADQLYGKQAAGSQPGNNFTLSAILSYIRAKFAAAPVAVSEGGTGGTSASAARLALSAETAGTAAAALLTHDANTDAHGQTVTGRQLLTAASVTAARTLLGVDPAGTSSTAITAHDAATNAHGMSPAGRAILQAPNAAAQRTAMGAAATGDGAAAVALHDADPDAHGQTATGRALVAAASAAAARTAIGAASTSIVQSLNNLFIGDSLTSATATPGATGCYPYKLVNKYPEFGIGSYTNVAVPGVNIATISTQYSANSALKPASIKDKTNVFCWAGTNGTVGTDGVNEYNALKALWATIKADGNTLYAFTLLPGNSYRNALNALIRSDRTLYDFLIEPDLLFPDNSDLAYYYGDGIHLLPASNDILAASIYAVSTAAQSEYLSKTRPQRMLKSLTVGPTDIPASHSQLVPNGGLWMDGFGLFYRETFSGSEGIGLIVNAYRDIADGIWKSIDVSKPSYRFLLSVGSTNKGLNVSGWNAGQNATSEVSLLSLTAAGGLFIGTSTVGVSKVLKGSVAWTPPSLADGAAALIDVTVTGVSATDFLQASFTGLTGNQFLVSAYYTAANTVRCVFMNKSGGSVLMAPGTVYVLATRAA